MNLKYDIFGVIKNAGKISVFLFLLWAVFFTYIFMDVGVTVDAYASIEPAGGPVYQLPTRLEESLAAPLPPEQGAEPQYRIINIRPYTNL